MVAVLHSHLSEGERHDEWHKIQSGRRESWSAPAGVCLLRLEKLD